MTQLRSFALNVLLLACIWSDIHFRQRLNQHAEKTAQEVKETEKTADVATVQAGHAPSQHSINPKKDSKKDDKEDHHKKHEDDKNTKPKEKRK